MRTIGCKVITTQNERKIPVANGHTQAAWTAENGAYTESNPTFAQTSIDAFKLTDLIKVSDELLSDSFFDIEATSPRNSVAPSVKLKRMPSSTVLCRPARRLSTDLLACSSLLPQVVLLPA